LTQETGEKMAIVAQKQLVLKIRFTKGKISENQI
jgi:hypothetical protein